MMLNFTLKKAKYLSLVSGGTVHGYVYLFSLATSCRGRKSFNFLQIRLIFAEAVICMLVWYQADQIIPRILHAKTGHCLILLELEQCYSYLEIFTGA